MKHEKTANTDSRPGFRGHPKAIRIYPNLPEFTRIYPNLPEFTRIYPNFTCSTALAHLETRIRTPWNAIFREKPAPTPGTTSSTHRSGRSTAESARAPWLRPRRWRPPARGRAASSRAPRGSLLPSGRGTASARAARARREGPDGVRRSAEPGVPASLARCKDPGVIFIAHQSCAYAL